MAIYDTDRGRYYNSKTDKFYDTYDEAVKDIINTLMRTHKGKERHIDVEEAE